MIKEMKINKKSNFKFSKFKKKIKIKHKRVTQKLNLKPKKKIDKIYLIIFKKVKYLYKIKKFVFKKTNINFLKIQLKKKSLLVKFNKLSVFRYIPIKKNNKAYFTFIKKKKTKSLKIFFIMKLNSIFIKKLFKILIKNGNKNKVYKIYLNWINIVKFKLKKNIDKNLYLAQLVNKIIPKLNSSIITKRGKSNLVSNVKKKKIKHFFKASTICCLWIKKSFNERKEKTFLLKFFSELLDIRRNKGASLKLKKSYYIEIYKNKKYIKYKKWI